jgi:rRNA processing protein Krr1/Pno1
MTVAKSMVGRVIGKQGETIKQLQRNTGANIQIDQSSDPCTITVTGQNANITNAMRDITTIVNDNGMGGGGYGRGGARFLLLCIPLCPGNQFVHASDTCSLPLLDLHRSSAVHLRHLSLRVMHAHLRS